MKKEEKTSTSINIFLAHKEVAEGQIREANKYLLSSIKALEDLGANKKECQIDLKKEELGFINKI